jgi:hypothetical protein
VISSLLRLASIACSAVLLISFGAFASDQARQGSQKTVAAIASAEVAGPSPDRTNLNAPSPGATTERMREQQHGGLREKIDDANDALVSPFNGVTSADSIWAQRIVAGLLALLVFGVGLGFLARLAALRGI